MPRDYLFLFALLPLLFVLCMACVTAQPAHAEVVSISFSVNGNNATGQRNPVPVGEPSNSSGLVLPGQVGPWNDLLFPSATSSGLITREVTVGDITFNFNTSVPAESIATFLNFPNAARDDLRSAYVNLSTDLFVLGNSDPVSWSITGLDPAKKYNVILFGIRVGGSVIRPADFSILGHDAGNGIGNPVTLDAENDGNFVEVSAPGGMIEGRFALRSGQSISGWSGLQIAVAVPEASQFICFVLLSAIMPSWRRRSNQQSASLV